MTSTSGPYITILAGLGGMAAFAYYTAHLADEALSKQSKEHLIDLLLAAKASEVARRSLRFFVAASDRWFGRKLFSLRAFAKSATLTLFWCFVVVGVNWPGPVATLLWSSPSFVDSAFTGGPIPSYIEDVDYRTFAVTLAKLIIAVVVIDYFSATLSRFLVRWSIKKRPLVVLSLPILDFVLSISLFLILYFIARVLVFENAFTLSLTEVKNWFHFTSFSIIRLPTDDNPTIVMAPDAVFLYSSLLTSVWLWCYVASYLLLFAAAKLDIARGTMLRVLDFGHKPAHAIAFFVVALSAAVAMFLLLLALIVRIAA